MDTVVVVVVWCCGLCGGGVVLWQCGGNLPIVILLQVNNSALLWFVAISGKDVIPVTALQ